MDWIHRVGIPLVAATASAVPVGCSFESEELDTGLPIAGTVTYHDAPVKKGAIHFLPLDPGKLPATGTIVDGEIRDVFTKKPGDGIKEGNYQIAVTAFDDPFLESVAKRNASGPDPVEVAKAANNIKMLIPARYSNPRESGLSAAISPSSRTLHLELVD